MQDKKKIYLIFTGIVVITCALAGAIGYLLDNTAGAIYSVVAGLIVTNFAAALLLYLPKSVMIKHYGTKEVIKEDSPDFIETVEEFAQAFNIPVPKFYLSNKDIPLIFTIGRGNMSASIIFTNRLMNILSSEEFTCVILHEMAHIKHDHILRQTLVAFIAGIFTLFATIVQWSIMIMGFGKENDLVPQLTKIFVMSLIAPPVALFIQLIIPDRREYIADTAAIKMYNEPETYVRMLEKMTRCFNGTRYEEINPSHGLLNIVDPLPHSNERKYDFNTLFSTHPDIDRRIEAIQTEHSTSKGSIGSSTTMIEKKGNKYKNVTRWKKTLLYSIIFHMLILFGINVIYTIYNKGFIARDSLIITEVYLSILVITYSMMYLIFRKRLS